MPLDDPRSLREREFPSRDRTIATYSNKHTADVLCRRNGIDTEKHAREERRRSKMGDEENRGSRAGMNTFKLDSRGVAWNETGKKNATPERPEGFGLGLDPRQERISARRIETEESDESEFLRR